MSEIGFIPAVILLGWPEFPLVYKINYIFSSHRNGHLLQ